MDEAPRPPSKQFIDTEYNNDSRSISLNYKINPTSRRIEILWTIDEDNPENG